MRPGTLMAAAIILPLLGAYAWNRSNLGGDYWAQQEAKRQCENVRALGVNCEQAQAPRDRKKKIECGARASLNRPVSS